MKRILGAAGVLLLLLASATAGFAAGYADIFYTVDKVNPNDPTDHLWEYSYKVVNPKIIAGDPSHSGIVDTTPVALGGGGITWFTIYFPTAEYSNVNPAATLPTHWRLQWLPPQYALDSEYEVLLPNGEYDTHYASILPDTSLSGFDVRFTYLGVGTPGPQGFKVEDLELQAENPSAPPLFEGRTQPLGVPEPLSVSMLTLGLLGLVLVRRKP
jgi:hypothetical protein